MTDGTIELLVPFKNFALTITANSGKEFAYHKKVFKKSQMSLSFCNSILFMAARVE